MSYDTEKVRLGREPLVAIGIVADTCSLTFSVGACTATGAAGTECFNTRKTCQDPANYAKTTKEYKFCQPRASLPAGEPMFPVIIDEPKRAGMSTTGGTGLGKRAVLKVKLKDFPHHDRGIDPYVANRTYTPEEQGSFWSKWLARNPYYEGRTLKAYYGYIGDTFSWSDFEVEEYDIHDIIGVTNETVEIVAKDILIRTYGRKTLYPPANTGELLADITDVATTATLTPAGIGNSEYAASGTLSIGKEAITFTRSADVLTLTRGQWGTTAKSHKAGDTVQECAAWDNTDVVDVVEELLTTGAGIAASWIPNTDWDLEQTDWLAGIGVTGILMKPEKIDKVIAELSESFMFDIWVDPVVKEIKLKALSPERPSETINTLTEANNIIGGSLKIDRRTKERFTEVHVHYNKIDFSEGNKIEDFASTQIAANVTLSDSDHYDGSTIKTIFSRWFDSQAAALRLATRLMLRFSDTPEYVTFKLDNKDDDKLLMAGRVELNSRQFVDEFGANEARLFQCIAINPSDAGHDVSVELLTSSFTGRYMFVASNSAPDYSAATDQEKRDNGYISPDSGEFSDGTLAYKLI